MPLYRLEDGSGLVGALAGMQRQTILHYPDATARAAQIKTPTLGMLTFIEAGTKFEWWNGTTWVALV